MIPQVCFGTPYQQHGQIENLQAFKNDPLAWSRPLVKHHCGEFSMAEVQANLYMEDKCQVEVGINSVFIGIYDGHKGNTVSILLRDHLFHQIVVLIKENNNNMDINILKRAIARIERAFMESAGRNVFVSSGCLICLIWRGTLYAANVGDSRAVLGSLTCVGRLDVKQMVRAHNLQHGNIQKELKNLKPDTNDNFLTMLFLRCKGLIETTRCIGYAYLKEEINASGSVEIPSWERVPESLRFTRPLLTSKPDVYSRILKNSDKFIIFGSSGFWKLMSKEDAAKVVNTSRREGITEKLATIALQNGANIRGRTYGQLIGLPKSDRISGLDIRFPNYDQFRSAYHDDITVVVVYLDNSRSNRAGVVLQMNSYRGCVDGAQESEYTKIYNNANPRHMYT